MANRMMAKEYFNCPHCNGQIYAIPKPDRLAIRPARTNRLTHLFESNVPTRFGGQQTLRSEAVAMPADGGDWERVTPVSKLEPRDILTSLLDAGVTFTFTTTIIGGITYATDGPLLAAPALGFCIAGARYYGLVNFALSLTKVKETFSTIVETFTPDPKEHKIKVSIDENTNNGRSFIEDEVSNRVSLDDLKAAAKAVYPHPHVAGQFCISRARLEREGLSQDKARLILAELKRLNYCHAGKGNKTVLSLRGAAVLRELSQNGRN